MSSKLNILVIILLVAGQVTSYRVLFLPNDARSHLMLFSSAAEAWVKAGHEAHVVKHHSVPVPTQYKDSGIHYFNYGKKDEIQYTMTAQFTKNLGQMSSKGQIEFYSFMLSMFAKFCDGILDEELFLALQKESYDFVLVDYLPDPYTCFHAVPYRLGIPHGTLGVLAPFDLFSHSLQTSYLTQTPPFYSKEPSFKIRLMQVIGRQAMRLGMKWFLDDSNVVRYLRDNPVDDLQDLRKKSKFWLVDWEPMLDGTRLSSPNIAFLGGVSASPVRRLPTDLKKFADSAKEGLVVVSFGGSMTSEFPDEMQRRLLTGLGMLKQKVVIRLKAKPNYDVSRNIHVTKWLPQNDVLGHPNTVLFITHCGISSVREGIHRGVPMLGMPNQDEQKTNGRRFQDRNYGLLMDRNTFTSEQLKETVDEILRNETIKSATKKAAVIIKSRRFTGAEEVVNWIEHVIKFGGDHLVDTSKLAWYEEMMYDIALVFLLMFLSVLFLIFKCCLCCGRMCIGLQKQKLA